ncbi:MAG: flagellar hook-length control protein FliK [Deltaproteobacteria bacterium]|nr:flagellar hook-length control protein FliK [Deltaproteobacteria bacterium]
MSLNDVMNAMMALGRDNGFSSAGPAPGLGDQNSSPGKEPFKAAMNEAVARRNDGVAGPGKSGDFWDERVERTNSVDPLKQGDPFSSAEETDIPSESPVSPASEISAASPNDSKKKKLFGEAPFQSKDDQDVPRAVVLSAMAKMTGFAPVRETGNNEGIKEGLAAQANFNENEQENGKGIAAGIAGADPNLTSKNGTGKLLAGATETGKGQEKALKPTAAPSSVVLKEGAASFDNGAPRTNMTVRPAVPGYDRTGAGEQSIGEKSPGSASLGESVEADAGSGLKDRFSGTLVKGNDTTARQDFLQAMSSLRNLEQGKGDGLAEIMNPAVTAAAVRPINPRQARLANVEDKFEGKETAAVNNGRSEGVRSVETTRVGASQRTALFEQAFRPLVGDGMAGQEQKDIKNSMVNGDQEKGSASAARTFQSALPGNASIQENGVLRADSIEGPGRGSNQAVVDQVVRALEQRSTTESGRVRLTLSPPKLGAVDCDIIVRMNKVQIFLQVENQAVRQMLHNGVDQLKQALADHGLVTDDISVSFVDNQNHAEYRSDQSNSWQYGADQSDRRNDSGDSPWQNVPAPEELPAEHRDEWEQRGLVSIFV